jgi:hypothetical protein
VGGKVLQFGRLAFMPRQLLEVEGLLVRTLFNTGRSSNRKDRTSQNILDEAEYQRSIHSAFVGYFGTNAGILQNKYTEDEWNAYYEGKIEPFAIQLSLVMSNMTYTARELSFGNAITFTANRLQYASNQTKLNISTQLFDRGLLNRNGVNGDRGNLRNQRRRNRYYLRRELARASDTNSADYEIKEGFTAWKNQVSSTAFRTIARTKRRIGRNTSLRSSGTAFSPSLRRGFKSLQTTE